MQSKLSKELTSDLLISKEVSEDMLCLICMEIMSKPTKDECPFASHSFCQLCIYNWLAQRQICPISKKAIDKGKLKPDLQLLEKIDQLETKCLNFSRKCNWIGKTKDFSQHLENCPKRIEVSNSGLIAHPEARGDAFYEALDEQAILAEDLELAAVIMDFTKETRYYTYVVIYNSLAALQLVYRKKSDPRGPFVYSKRVGGLASIHPKNVDKREVFQLRENDRLTKIVGFLGSGFYPLLSFETEQFPSPVYFGYPELATGSQTIALKPQAKIIGIQGSAGWVMDKFGFVVLEAHDD